MCFSEFLPSQIKKALQIGSGHPERKCILCRERRWVIARLTFFLCLCHGNQHTADRGFSIHLLMAGTSWWMCSTPETKICSTAPSDWWRMLSLQALEQASGQLWPGTSPPLYPVSSALLPGSYAPFLSSTFWWLTTSGSSDHKKGCISPEGEGNFLKTLASKNTVRLCNQVSVSYRQHTPPRCLKKSLIESVLSHPMCQPWQWSQSNK